MPTVHLMPWCKLDRSYKAEPVTLLPFNRADTDADLDDSTTEAILAVLNDFIGIDGQPISECTLIGLGRRVLFDDYADASEIETLRDYVDLACLAGLSVREFYGRAEPYCNSDCFDLYSRRYDKGWGTSAPPIRRRDGTFTGLTGRALCVNVPVHAAAFSRISIEQGFFRALGELRSTFFKALQADRWRAWQEAIFCFNEANTDGEGTPSHIEWVLMASAMQRVLDTKSSTDDFGKKVARSLRSNLRNDSKREILEHWAKEFYRLRGDYAHGKLRTRQRPLWAGVHHLLCGAIAFPLIVKCQLEREGVYELTALDRSGIAALAILLKDLKDSHAPMMSWLQYVTQKARTEV